MPPKWGPNARTPQHEATWTRLWQPSKARYDSDFLQFFIVLIGSGQRPAFMVMQAPLILRDDLRRTPG